MSSNSRIFETMTIKTLFKGCETELTSIYKPPGLSNDQFLLFCKMLDTPNINSVLHGDINIDYYKGENTDVFTHFCAAGLGPLIDRPTRITQNSQSCIDYVFSNIRGATGFVLDCYIADHLAHGPLKLRTVHFSDSTIIYENKVSKQNIFPWFKGTIESRAHPKFQINCSF
jgi:hypothetical protein